ncbi:MAG TPA: ABC transporter permease [Acidimicrobiales bacterium]|nr:ABC transporter permease [Acidimicrobiales bacterium]
MRRSALALYIPLGALILLVVACFFGPWILHLPPASFANIANSNLPLGSPGHLLGTDQLGNDMLSRTLVGGRVSMVVGFGATLVGFVIGTSIGVVAGYFGGAVETVLMRILDMVLAFPSLILAMTLVVFLGPSERNEIIAISFFAIPNYARLSRAATLKIREREYVLVGRVIGAGPRHIMIRHVFSNVLPSLLTIVPLTVAVAMIIEATLSFLGLGVRPPTPSWGNMIAQGQATMSIAPQDIIIPAVGLFLTVLFLNLTAEQWRLRISQ